DSAHGHRARGDRAARTGRGAEDVELDPEGRRRAAEHQPPRDELQDQGPEHRVPARPPRRAAPGGTDGNRLGTTPEVPGHDVWFSWGPASAGPFSFRRVQP